MSKDTFLAYGEERHALETVMRMHSVKRWHMVDTTRQQTLAEHSANVAMLVLLIVRSLPITVTQGENKIGPGAVIAALVHDIPECFTGDISTLTKPHISGLDKLENMVTPQVFWSDMSPGTKLLIKLCDLADGIRFIRLHGVDTTARHAREGLEQQFAKKRAEAQEMWGDASAKISNILTFYAYENS